MRQTGRRRVCSAAGARCARSGSWRGYRGDNGSLSYRRREAESRNDQTSVVCNRLPGGNVIAAVCVFSVCMQWVCVISMLHCAGLPDRIFYVGSGFPAYTTACTLLNNTVKARYYEFIC